MAHNWAEAHGLPITAVKQQKNYREERGGKPIRQTYSNEARVDLATASDTMKLRLYFQSL